MHLLKAKYEHASVLLLFVLISLFLLWGTLFSSSYIGFNHDWAFPMQNGSLKIFCSESLFVWNEANTGSAIVYPAENLLRYSLFPFSILGLSGLVLIKAILLLVFTFSGYFMYSLLRNSFKLSYLPSLVSGFFYITTPVIFNKIAAGQIPYVIAYGLSPIILAFFIKYATTYETKNLIIASLLLAFATIQVQFAIMLTLLFFLYAILIAKMKIGMLIKTFSFMILLVSLVHMFWLLPGLISSSFGETLQGASSIENLQTWGTSFVNAFRMVGYRSPHFEIALSNFSYRYVWDIASLAIVFFSFGSLLIKKSRITLFFAGISLVTLIFTTVTGPFATVVFFLYSLFPIFNVFREVYHLAFLIAFSYSIMLAFFVQAIINSKKLRSYLKIVFVIVMLGVVIMNDPFIYSGNFSGQVQQYQLNDQNLSIINGYLRTDGDYRVLYLPMIQPFKYDNLTYNGIDPVIAYSTKPTIGNYIDSDFLTQIAVEFHLPSSNLTNILSILSVKYVFFRDDLQSMLPLYLNEGQLPIDNGYYNISSIWTNDNILKTLSNQQNLELLTNTENLIAFEDEDFLPHIYSATIPIAVDGNTDQLFTLLTSSAINNMDNKAIFLSEQLNQEQWQFIKNNNNTCFAEEKTTNVQSYNGLEKPFNWATMPNDAIEMRYYSGWKSVIRTDGKNNKDSLSFSSPNITPYIFPTFSENSWNALDSTLIYIKTGMESFVIDGILENGKSLNDIAGIWWQADWMGMGTKPTQYPVVIPPNQQAIIQSNHIINDNVTIQSIEVPDLSQDQAKSTESPTITYQKIDPTRYEVKIVNATMPFFMVFDENYHSGWQASVEDKLVGDENHFIVNGFANCWYINKKGTFTITLKFWPQNLFYAGSAISLTALILCAVYLSKDKIKTVYKRYIKKTKPPLHLTIRRQRKNLY